MALFDADKIFRSLVSAMGLTPEMISGFVNEVVTEVRAIRSERAAFKAACQREVPELHARLDRIERLLNEIRHAPGLTLVEPFTTENEHVGQSDNDRTERVNGHTIGA